MQISNLPASNSFSSTDVLPIEINGVTYKVTGAILAAALQALGNYLTPDNVANNLTTTAAGSVLDARQGKVLNDKINATQSDIAIIIEGNQTTHTGGVAVGEYVIVRNSTISGITDGLYKAVQAIPANTAIDSTYLAAVSGGGLNAIKQSLATETGIAKITMDQLSFTRKGSMYIASVSLPDNTYNIPTGVKIAQVCKYGGGIGTIPFVQTDNDGSNLNVLAIDNPGSNSYHYINVRWYK